MLRDKLPSVVSGHEGAAESSDAAAFPLYGVEAWAGQRRVASYSGVRASGQPGDNGTLMSVTIEHSLGDLSVSVTSTREHDGDLSKFRVAASLDVINAARRADGDAALRPGDATSDAARLEAAAWNDQLAWRDVTILVDAQPVTFEVYELDGGWWVAVGRGADVDLSVVTGTVALTEVALARATELAVPTLRARRDRRPRNPPWPSLSDADRNGGVPDHARVDVIFERNRLLSGSVGGQTVRLELNLPTHHGEATGTIAGIPISATWENGDNYFVYPDVPSDLKGTFAGEPVELHATFHHDAGGEYHFEHGTVRGQVGAEDLNVVVQGAARGTREITAKGSLGDTEFALKGAVDGSLTFGMIRGTVADKAIHIDAARTEPPSGVETRLTGAYEGSMALLALAVGGLLHFI